MLGLATIHTEQAVSVITHRFPASDWVVAIVVAVSYAAGHLLLSLATLTLAVWKLISRSRAWQRLKGLTRSQPSARENISQELFQRYVELQIGAQKFLRSSGNSPLPAVSVPFNELRNIAMTLSTEAAALGYRFMSISLFCLGVGTALCVIVVDSVICRWVYPASLVVSDAIELIAQSIVILFFAYLLFRRAAEFRRRALDTPFSVALTHLLFDKREAKKGG